MSKFHILPTKMSYRLLSAYCLMSLLPIMAGMYAASLFIRFPFDVNQTTMFTVSAVIFFSLFLSYLGYRLSRELTDPIEVVAAKAHLIAEGKQEGDLSIKGVEELEDLSQSLLTISRNARELLDKVEKLTLKDKLTGLYNAPYIRERLGEEIQRAVHTQCPCSFVYLVVDGFDAYAAKKGEAESEKVLKGTAHLINQYLSEFDRAARVARNEFVIIFPDRNKKEVIELSEKVSKDFRAASFVRNAGDTPLTMAVGVSENPLDGIKTEELYLKAQKRMRLAQGSGKGLEAFA